MIKVGKMRSSLGKIRIGWIEDYFHGGGIFRN